jgi:hypothetical protein
MQEAVELGAQSSDDARSAMANVEAADAAGKIEKAIAIDVLEKGAFGARGENGRGVIDAARDGRGAAAH